MNIGQVALLVDRITTRLYQSDNNKRGFTYFIQKGKKVLILLILLSIEKMRWKREINGGK